VTVALAMNPVARLHWKPHHSVDPMVQDTERCHQEKESGRQGTVLLDAVFREVRKKNLRTCGQENQYVVQNGSKSFFRAWSGTVALKSFCG
jgi:hypothetical protein